MDDLKNGITMPESTIERTPPKKQGLTYDEAVRAVRSGQVIMEHTPAGTKRSINFDKRAKKHEMERLGLKTDRQWQRYKQQLRNAKKGQ